MPRVTVLTGGVTPERDVALAGAAQVVAALRSRGYAVTMVDTVTGPLDAADEERLLRPAVGREPPRIEELRLLAERESLVEIVCLPAVRDADLVFPVLHGRQGEGGALQALLDAVDVPYAGSGAVGSVLAMDKDVAKRLFRDAGIPTPDWCMWPAEDATIASLGMPLIVKPSKAGSTVGLTVVRSAEDVLPAVDTALQYDDEALLERYIGGREYTVGVLENRALAVGEIIPAREIFDYECKYTPGLTREIFPADLPSEEAARLGDLALRAHRALKLRDFSRVDFRLDGGGTPHCLEVNTLPGLTATSLLPQSAGAVGLGFADLCDRICRAAWARARRRNRVQT